MDVCLLWVLCVLPGRDLCDELITRSKESYRLRCVVVCDLETSWMRRGLSRQNKQNLLTQWSRILVEKLNGFQLVKEFPSFYGTRMFITAFTSVSHLSIYWASSIQSIPSPHPTSWKSILIMSYHLGLGLPVGPFPSGFPTKTLYNLSSLQYVLHALPIPLFSAVPHFIKNYRRYTIINFLKHKIFKVNSYA